MKPEIRRLTVRTEIRLDQDSGGTFLRGSIPYNREAVIAGLFREVIRPGAFRRAIEERQDVVARYNHDDTLPPLGRVSSGTLRLWETDEAFHYEVALRSGAISQEIAEAARRGDISQSSFAFIVRGPESGDERWSETWTDEHGNPTEPDGDGGLPLRELLSIYEVVDVAPVTWGAYGADSTATARQSLRSAEAVLDEYQATRRLEADAQEGELARRRALLAARLRLIDDEDRIAGI